ncbi:MAG: FtsX-like permease family protein [Armatimonadetes bacterium]|nr:FtsX-like permease family protein [Armatimonadota bacterium]
MTLIEVVGSAIRAMRESRLRAWLSVLGVVIGVASVVLLVSIGVGVRVDITRQVDSLGTNVAFVVPGKLDETGRPDGMSFLGISTLTLDDVAALSAAPGVVAAIPLTFVFGSVQAGNVSHSAVVLAADGRIADMRKEKIAEGRFYTVAEDDQRVCVIGHELRSDIFGSGPALGKEIEARGVRLRVIGVLAPEEPSAFSQMSFSRVTYIPWRAAGEAFPGAQINRIIVQTDYRTDPDLIVKDLRSAMLTNHEAEDFGILTYKQLLSAIFRVFGIVTALVVGISAISLVVAGIGIMNIMLVTVTERTREIGVRMTVGARRRDVFMQFLAESVGLSVLGGVLGVAIAYAGTAILRATTVLTPIVTPGVLGLALGVCIAVGVLFGTAPATRASRLSPIDALRYE